MMKKLLFPMLLTGIAAQAQWVEQASGFNEPSRTCSELHIVDANVVWGLGADGSLPVEEIQEFTRTVDGGENWIAGNIEVFDPDLQVNNLWPIDGQTAYVSMINPDLGGGFNYKTTDGGESWNLTNPGSYSETGSFLNVIHFFDANTGITQGDPVNGEFEIWRTVDGGDNWALVPGANLPDPTNTDEFGYNGGNVSAGTTLWCPTSLGNLLRTTDMGATWTKIDTPISDFGGVVNDNSQGSAYFSNDNNGIIIGTANAQATNPTYTLYKTVDGGANWTSEPYAGPYFTISYVPGTDILVGTASDDEGYITGYSLDNGSTWTEFSSSETDQKYTISFLNQNLGWAAGFNEDSSTGGMFKFTGSLSVSEMTTGKFVALPNPTRNVVHLINQDAAIADVTAFDFTGKQVYSEKVDALNDVAVDFSGFNSGIYMVRVTDANGQSQVLKVVKN
jgi:photosystem II stability/assembly factor-like uncharacterized protein